MMDRSHFVALIHHVNPLDIIKLDIIKREPMGAMERIS